MFVRSIGEEYCFGIEEYKALCMRGYEGLKIPNICEWYWFRIGKIKDKGRFGSDSVVEIGVLLLKIIVTNSLFFEYLSNLELISAFKESIGFVIEIQYG